MYRKLPRLLMLPLLLGSILAFSAKVTASPKPNLCPGHNSGGEGLEIYAPRLKFYAETKDRYINICGDNRGGEYYYVSKLKSGGNTVAIPVWKVDYGWISKNTRHYVYELSAFSNKPKLTIVKEGKLIFDQNLLSNAASYPN